MKRDVHRYTMSSDYTLSRKIISRLLAWGWQGKSGPPSAHGLGHLLSLKIGLNSSGGYQLPLDCITMEGAEEFFLTSSPCIEVRIRDCSVSPDSSRWRDDVVRLMTQQAVRLSGGNHGSI